MSRTIIAALAALFITACSIDDVSESEQSMLGPDAQPAKVVPKKLELADCGNVAPDPKKPHPMYPDCPAFTPTAESCAGVWMQDAAGKDQWVKGDPICLGQATHIKQCSKCNRLDVPNEGDPKAPKGSKVFDPKGCLNQKFIACANANLLPNQGAAKPCFIDEPGALNIYPPITNRNYTGREMCFFAWLKKPPGFQTDKEVAACKKAAGCPDTYAAAPPATRDGCTCVCSAETGCDTSACEAEIAEDALCSIVTTEPVPVETVEPTTTTDTTL